LPLEVIGAGFPRTGTASLKLALEQLGFGPCHHMREIIMNPKSAALWVEAAKAPAKANWDKVLEGYDSCTDAPGCNFWRELAAYYPKAKVLLSVRDPEKWFESTQATVLSPMMKNPLPGLEEFFATAVWRDVGDRGSDHDFMIDLFHRHIENVKREIPNERLLVFDVREGWAPLCKFLGVPVPATPFPVTNSREEMMAMRAASGAFEPGKPLDLEQIAQFARERFGKP
jgi:hypothetical protein